MKALTDWTENGSVMKALTDWRENVSVRICTEGCKECGRYHGAGTVATDNKRRRHLWTSDGHIVESVIGTGLHVQFPTGSELS